MTKLIKTIEEWKKIRKTLDNKTLGFVPTMGNLHEGHVSLLRRSILENTCTVMSCFVNPTQFNNANDLEHYPRTLTEDLEIADQAGVDYCFSPEYSALYPDDYQYSVTEKTISRHLDGEHRPGHFDGVMTVVLKLLQLMQADFAYFGEKDYQQLQLVKGMVDAFFVNTKIVGCPTIRNAFDLPLSSRNGRLTKAQLKTARYFPEYFHSNQSCGEITRALQEKGFEVEYVKEHQGRRFAAVRLGDVRLIDNVIREPVSSSHIEIENFQ